MWADTLEDLEAKAQARLDQEGWYFATAAFNAEQRLQANVSAKRCFYFDLDAGAEKYAKHGEQVYETQKDALEAVVAFARATKLLPSMIVSSGAGLHVYYALDSDIEPDVWKPAADALKKFAQSCGLRIDASCTGDSARVLRYLGGLHANGNRVELLKNTGKVWSLADLYALVPAAAPAPKLAKAASDLNDEILESGSPLPVSAVKIAESCGALRTISQSRGNVQEPVWRGMLGLVKFCVEGADLAHKWSEGHPDYDYDQTQDKFDRYAAKPTTCDYFADYCVECNTCPHRSQIKSPIALGNLYTPQEKIEAGAEVSEEDQLIAEEATPYLLGDNYRVQMFQGKHVIAANVLALKGDDDEDDDEGTQREWVPFSNEVWWIADWTESGADFGDNCSMTVRHIHKSAVMEFPLDMSLIADNKRLFTELAGKGVRPLTYGAKHRMLMQNYINNQITRIKAAASKPVIRRHFGFQFDRAGKLICAQGPYVLCANGEIRSALIGRRLEASRDLLGINCLPENNLGVWEKDVWKTHILPGAKAQVDFYRRYYGESNMSVAQLAIMLHLASPMLVFTAPNEMTPNQPLPAIGFTVSMYSADSGKGKSAIQHAASCAFGDPNNMVKSGGADDMTVVAQAARASALGTMPLGLDEVTQNSSAQVGATINRISGGSARMRGAQDGSIARAPETWALISIVSTNMPQREMLSAFQKSSDALQMRLLELNCDALPPVRADAMAEYEATRNEVMVPNIGALGACINLWCVSKGVKAMREIMRVKLDDAAKLMGGSNRERFLLKGLACLLAVQDALTQMGIAPFEMEPMVEEYRRALGDAREYSNVARKGGVGQLRKLLADLSTNFLVTNGESQGGREDVIENERTLRLPLHGRQVRSGHYTYVTVDAMQEWCQAQGYSFSQLVREATDAGIFMPVEGDKLYSMVNLTRGVTRIASKRSPCYKVNDVALYGRDVSPENIVDLRAKENGNAGIGTDRAGGSV